MLEQNGQQPNSSSAPSGSGATPSPNGTAPFDLTRPLDGAAKFIPVRTSQLTSPAAPISVPAPRAATAVPLAASPSQTVASKLSDLVNRADRALPRLETRLSEEQAATERAVRLTADIEERLKLGVRMLQAFDVQSARGESIASRAVKAIEEVERVLASAVQASQAALNSDAERLTREKLEEIARELDAQRERFRQFEQGAGQLAQEKLERIQHELDAQLGRIKRADLDATALADDRLASIRSLCDAQVDRLSRASADSVADAERSAKEILDGTEVHLARLADAQEQVDRRESARIERFEAELTARAAAALALAEQRAADSVVRIEHATANGEERAARVAEQSIAQLENEVGARIERVKQAEARVEHAAAAAEERAARVAEQSIAQLENELDARIDRAKEVEARITLAAATAEGRAARFAEQSIAQFENEVGARIERVKQAEARVEHAAAAAEERAARVAEQSIAQLENELNWRLERVKEVEARIEHAANMALAAVDTELGGRLAHIDSVVRRADEVAARADDALARMAEAGAMIERSERATAALAGLSGESLRLIETLATRVSDATALREVLGKIIHELAAAREVVHGDMRRMRDDLGWLVEKSERLTGDLIERADHAATTSDSIRAITDAAQPVLADLRVWGPILEDPSREGVRPITTAIASGVREELTSDMHGFASALRQLAASADGAFKSVTIETGMFRDGRPGDATARSAVPSRDLARMFERELAQLGPVSTFSSDPAGVLSIPTPAGGVSATPPTLAANRPLDLEA